MDGSWKLDWQFMASRSQAVRLSQKHPREFASCMDNLDRVVGELNAGKRVGGFSFGFFRSEGQGVYRIGQTKVRSPCELRLYVFPKQETATLHILGLGDKNTQQKDIQEAHRQARAI